MSFLQRKTNAAKEHFVVTHFDANQDGTLAKTERAVYEQHLEGCQECQKWVRRQESLVTRLEWEMPPAVVLSPATAARIQQDSYHAMRRAAIMNNIKALVTGAGAFALLVIAVGVIVWWQSGGLAPGMQVPGPLQAPVAEESAPAEDAAPLSADVAQELDDLFSAYQENGIFNGSVLVALGDDIILSEGYGMADAEKEIPNTDQTRFWIGHISQTFTAVAILQLQEQGKLAVDDPICQYLDDCPAAWQAITINDLLFHSSGIEDYVYQGGPLSAGVMPEELMNSIIDLPLAFEPGSQSRYSNSGYVILGIIIERVAGQPYLAFLQENIFDPLAMADTGLDAGAGELAVGYSYGSTEAEAFDIAPLFATASLYATTKDLYRFSQALQTEQLLSQASYDQLFASYSSPFADSDLIAYFATWAGGPIDGRQVLFCSGDEASGRNPVGGFQSILTLYPEDDLTVILLENLGIADPDPVVTQVAKRVLGDA